jgi:hypothetical protein
LHVFIVLASDVAVGIVELAAVRPLGRLVDGAPCPCAGFTAGAFAGFAGRCGSAADLAVGFVELAARLFGTAVGTALDIVLLFARCRRHC